MPAEEAILSFPCIGNGPKQWLLFPRQIERWSKLYPTLDIEAECRRALAWIEANRENRKTAGGMERFLIRWFNRCVEKGGGRAGPSTGSIKTAGNAEALRRFIERGAEA